MPAKLLTARQCRASEHLHCSSQLKLCVESISTNRLLRGARHVCVCVCVCV